MSEPMSPYAVVTLAERPALDDTLDAINHAAWPEFMNHDPVANRNFGELFDEFPDFQFVLFDGEAAVAIGHSLPVRWQGPLANLPADGWDWALETGCAGRRTGRAPTMLCAISAVMAPGQAGKGVSAHVIRAMKAIAQAHGLDGVIAPVRPSLKHRYPLTPMARYLQWRVDDGAPFDPWLRTHWHLGGRVLKIAPRSMTIPGSVAEWESWTGMRFPESGPHIVPGALAPVEFDLARDSGVYTEANVWMRHAAE